MMKVKKKSLLLRILLVIAILFVLCFLSIIITVSILYNRYDLDIDKLTSVNNGIRVYSATGTDSTLYNTDRSIIELDTLPDYVLQAFISTEDKHFYTHHGYDLGRILKASIVNIANRSKDQGASTISQQLIKNALLTNEKTYRRKLKEIILSIKLEKKFSKNEILEMYLNTIYFGSNAYGIENASITYFNKSAKELTLNEACCLAGIIKSPNYYSPRNNYEKCLTRKNLVAQLMYENGYITQEQYDEIERSPLIISNNKNFDHSYEEEAIYEACTLLNLTERELINNKYQIVTFKDDNLQADVVSANNDIILSSETTNNCDLDSLSIVTKSNGQIVAYLGNSNYNLHNISRQPASTLKPLAVYLPALEYDIISPSQEILDEPIDYNGFAPKNADDTYHGYVSVRDSIAQSLNVPAVKTLDCVGLNRARDTLSKLGIEISNSDLNLSLSLGAVKNGVKLMDLLSAYNTISNLGTAKHLTFIDKILDKDGNIIYEYVDYSNNVVDSASCFLLTDMLIDSADVGTARRLSSLEIPVASKTGTASNTNGNTDLYNIAYTTEHTMLTWISSIKNNTLPNTMHSSAEPTEINKKILSKLYNDHRPADFTKPMGVEYLAFDVVELENSHMLMSNNDTDERYLKYDYFKSTNTPATVTSNTYTPINVTVDSTGAHISFSAKRNVTYTLYREDKIDKFEIKTIRDTNGTVCIIDKDIFKYNDLNYFLIGSNGEIISDIVQIRPKDYLINRVTNEVLKNKKKWYV